MGAALLSCVSRERVDCCGSRPLPEDDEYSQELRQQLERDRLLTVLEEKDAGGRHQLERFYTAHELCEVDEFLQQFAEEKKSPPRPLRANTLISMNCGPWGIGEERGGSDNCWDDLDATGYVVRGAGYLSDYKKQPSLPALATLVVMDMFFSKTDIPNVAECEAAKTVHRVRRSGEDRRLLVLNFRLVPLHVVIVFALPASGDGGPAESLMNRFFRGMPNPERRSRLKGIPRVRQGPWAVRRIVGENHPAILGRNIPINFYEGENYLECSFGISRSSAAQRVTTMLLRAARAIDIEMCVTLEGQSSAELPERILGGFRCTFVDLETLRTVDPSSPASPSKANEAGRATRPKFLETEENAGSPGYGWSSPSS